MLFRFWWWKSLGWQLWGLSAHTFICSPLPVSLPPSLCCCFWAGVGVFPLPSGADWGHCAKCAFWFWWSCWSTLAVMVSHVSQLWCWCSSLCSSTLGRGRFTLCQLWNHRLQCYRTVLVCGGGGSSGFTLAKLASLPSTCPEPCSCLSWTTVYSFSRYGLLCLLSFFWPFGDLLNPLNLFNPLIF